MIHGRTIRSVAEDRAAVRKPVETDNRHWRLEKLGYLTLLEARAAITQALVI